MGKKDIGKRITTGGDLNARMNRMGNGLKYDENGEDE